MEEGELHMSKKIEMSGEYWNTRYERGGINLACPHVWKHIMNKIETGKENVLDIGCGVGLGLRLINLLHPEKKLYGVDISELAVERVNKYLPNAILECEKVPPLNYDDDFFDIIICTEFLEHITDPVFALKEIKRVLKPEGKVLITIPNNCLGSAPEHLHQWNFDEFNNLLNSIKFQILNYKVFRIDANADYLFMEVEGFD